MVLEGLKDGDDGVGGATEALNSLIYVFQVNAHDAKSEVRSPKSEVPGPEREVQSGRCKARGLKVQ
jgi:hypothetical protein